MRFKVGDTVKLKGVLQNMRVIEIADPQIECEWFDDAGLRRRENFREKDLEPVDPNEPIRSEMGPDHDPFDAA